MSVSSEDRVAGPFTAGGSLTFNYTFDVFDVSEIRVTHTDADDQQLVLVLNIDYTVNLGAKSVTIVSPYKDGLVSADMITLNLLLPITQARNLVNQGSLNSGDIEEMFDRITLIQNQQQEVIDRCYKVDIGEAFDETALTPGKYNLRPVLLAEQNVSWDDPVAALEVWSANAEQYDRLRLEIPWVGVKGSTSAFPIRLRPRINNVWSAVTGRYWAAWQVDSLGVGVAHNPASDKAEIRVSDLDFDRGGSYGTLSLEMTRYNLYNLAGHFSFMYTDPTVNAAKVVSINGACSWDDTAGTGIDGFQIWAKEDDPSDANMYGRVRLWGIPTS